MDGLEIRLTEDFSKETSEHRRAFLALRPRLRQLEVKYGLFELARMWITKNGVSKDFYDPEDLRVFFGGLQLQTQSMDIVLPARSQDLPGTTREDTPPNPNPTLGEAGRTTADPQARGRDLERLTKSHNKRGQVLQAVVLHTQTTDRDKSRSPLKPTVTST
ncbi:hypothetical protein NDU88_002869 [Pleurodeles waltl]|uniref:Uncharacterized protein n=1 Tax=Pleurodeles waltl TaxID=8319 RepID=A0AAV7VF07_PLEWA|nr:hypothetical protein NDU88_002869 [Pleurodeles waltl]